MSKTDQLRRVYGQFFTPDSVVACCYGLLAGALPSRPRIVDPACGDGAFLCYAAERGIAPAAAMAGCDIDPALVAALVAGGMPGVRCADGLAPNSLAGASFDLVIGNPPFGVATAGGGRAAPASEVRFLLRALELARPGGHIALVLPSGVLANERLRPLRAELLDRATVLAVLALPRATFRDAGTSAACSILLLRNAPAPPGHRVFFGQAGTLDDLPIFVATYHHGPVYSTAEIAQVVEKRISSAINAVSALSHQPAYWLAQSPDLAWRLDVAFWRPDHRELLERMAARHPLRPLGELLDRRRNLIAGDHVRPSLGEARGTGLPYEYYQTREFLPAGYNYAALERCDERAFRRLRHTAVRRHDILVSCAGVGGAGQGRTCLITHQPGPSCTGDVLILRAEHPDPVFLYLFLRSRCGRAQLLRLQNGVGTVNLSADELLQVELPLIPAAVQHDLAARYAPVAAAHDATMAALTAGDERAYQRARARAEDLLSQLVYHMEEIALGG